jgi:uncharacterized protein YndB with AHSA1/START domain
MTIGDHRMSASLVTVQFRPARNGKGTELTFTDQGAYFERSDGVHMREQGWTHILEQLNAALSA